MLIETTADVFGLALAKVKPAVERRNTIPILSTVLITNGVVTATNLDMQVCISFPAKSMTGAAAVPFFQLYRIVSNLPPETEIRIEDANRGEDKSFKHGVRLSFDGGSYWLPSQDPDEFPVFKTYSDTKRVVLPDGFKKALEKVLPAISTEETRYYLNGVCFSKNKDDEQVLVTTDGHRLIAHKYDHGIEGQKILPRMMIPAIMGLPEPTAITYSDLHFDLEFPGGSMSMKLIDGVFPDWGRVVPEIKGDQPKLTLNPQTFTRVIKRIAENTRLGVCLAASSADQTLTVSQVTADGDEGMERVPDAAVENWPSSDSDTPQVWSFNANYLLDLCRLYRLEDEIVITAQGKGQPTHVFPLESKTSSVLMPMREMDAGFAERSVSFFAHPQAQNRRAA
ncbi:hypothetical protein [uncultured Roseibium sp.]|uniref:DNA polymerase III subunit beta n=1 Tax=uncultured Roseibium sp. TaxID=1936171 RepID=UPI0026065066|nr:hypothetical protein [uncultured Roseibium sp.]